MAIQFDSSPYLRVWERQHQNEQERQNRMMQGNQDLLGGLQFLAENRRQQQMMDLQKENLAATRGQQDIENRYKFGTPVDPNLEIGMPSQQTGVSRLFGGQQMPVGQGSRLIDEFNKFRSGGMRTQEVRPEFIGALPLEERKQYFEQASPKYQEEVERLRSQSELDRARAANLGQTGSEFGKAPAGFRWTSTGDLEPITGGPADLKKQVEKQAAESASLAQKDKANLVIQKVNQALSKVSGFSAGGMAATENIPFVGQMTGATDLASDLETIKALLGFEQLAEMKSTSRAGASGLGALSDREMRLLTAARASLEQSQSSDQLRKRLGEVKTHYQNWLKMEEGINPYGNGGDQSQSTDGPQIGEVRKGYRFMGGNPADRNSWEPVQ